MCVSKKYTFRIWFSHLSKSIKVLTYSKNSRLRKVFVLTKLVNIDSKIIIFVVVTRILVKILFVWILGLYDLLLSSLKFYNKWVKQKMSIRERLSLKIQQKYPNPKKQLTLCCIVLKSATSLNDWTRILHEVTKGWLWILYLNVWMNVLENLS